MGCLKAFAKSSFQRTFYDLGRVGYWGPQSKKKVDFAFDTTRTFERPDAAQIADTDEGWVTMHGPKIEHRRRQGELNAALAIGQTEQLTAPIATPMACGGGTGQLDAAEAARY
jgi:anaerobic magnesium-protoporphyrin IX monomethyl ester cyclase